MWDVTAATKYYANGQRVAQRQGSTVYYFTADHLGSTSLVTDASGNEVARQKYYPFGAPRSTSGTLPTDYRFTGQRSEEAALGSLYDYGARFYSPVLGQFLSADTLVPQPGNPQALNRYAYTLNNPLRYTDPTGMFSEDEIMKYLGVDSWDAVLALFGEDGRYAGLWGWLEVLRQAQIGSTFGIYSATSRQVFSGRFAQGDGDYLFLEGEYLYPAEGWAYSPDGRPYYFRADTSANLPPEAAAWLGQGGGYYVNASNIAAHAQYLHLKFDPARIDQQALQDELQSAGATVGGGLLVAGASSGNIPLAAAGGALVVNGIRVDISSAVRSIFDYRAGTVSGWELAADLVVTGGGYTPLGPYFDAVSIGRTMSRGFYQSP